METSEIPIWKWSKLLDFVLLPIRSQFGFVHLRVVCAYRVSCMASLDMEEIYRQLVTHRRP
jgi:hypothetical protein